MRMVRVHTCYRGSSLAMSRGTGPCTSAGPPRTQDITSLLGKLVQPSPCTPDVSDFLARYAEVSTIPNQPSSFLYDFASWSPCFSSRSKFMQLFRIPVFLSSTAPGRVLPGSRHFAWEWVPFKMVHEGKPLSTQLNSGLVLVPLNPIPWWLVGEE